MRILIYSLATIAVYSLQSIVVIILANTAIKPNIPLTVILCISLHKGEVVGGLVGLINGILDDALYGSVLGLSAMAKFFSCYILGWITRNVYKGPVIITMITVFIGSMLYHSFMAMLGASTGILINPWHGFISLSLKSAFFNVMISPLVCGIIVKSERFFDHYFSIKY